MVETSELHFNECHYFDPEIIFTQSTFFILLEWLHFLMIVFTATAKEARITLVWFQPGRWRTNRVHSSRIESEH
jgi:hypothetical protein